MRLRPGSRVVVIGKGYTYPDGSGAYGHKGTCEVREGGQWWVEMDFRPDVRILVAEGDLRNTTRIEKGPELTIGQQNALERKRGRKPTRKWKEMRF